MEHERLTDATECVAIGDLIALYRALEKAHVSLVGAEVNAARETNSRSEIEQALIRDECAEVKARMVALRREILTAPVRSRLAAIQIFRFRLIECGDDPDAVEAAVRTFTNASPTPADHAVEGRIAEIEGQVALIAMALSMQLEKDGKHCRLLAAMDSDSDQLAALQRELHGLPHSVESAA